MSATSDSAALQPLGHELLCEVHLAYAPVAWLDRGELPLALYRLPDDLADLLLHTCGESAVLDCGPVQPGDTAELLAIAAAIFDARDPGAPFADASITLTTARQVLATDFR